MNRKCGVRNTQCNAKSALYIAELKKFYAAYGWPIFYWTSLIILLLLFFIEIECWFGINVWRHDEVYYLPDYWAKFCEEGRWLNFILFPALRIFPAHLAITLCYCCLFYYAFTCAKPFIANKNALLFGLAALQVCSLYDLLTWPVISLPSFLALAGFTFLKEKLDWRAVFLLGGIIFSGGFNNFYNLLPLLYLREIYTGKISLLKLLAYYVLCFVLGFCCAQLAVFLVTGHGIQIADWRKPNYIRQFSDFLINFQKEYYYLCAYLGVLGKWWAPLLLGGIVLTFLMSPLRRGEKRIQVVVPFGKCLLLTVTVMLSSFFQAFPVGLEISMRTVISMYLGLLSIPILIFERWKTLGLAILISLALMMFRPSYGTLRFYQVVTSIWYENLLKIDVDPRRYRILFLPDSMEMKQEEDRLKRLHGLYNYTKEYLDTPMRWVPAAHAAGFASVVFNGDDTTKETSKIIQNLPLGKYHKNDFYQWQCVDDWLVIKLNRPADSGK